MTTKKENTETAIVGQTKQDVENQLAISNEKVSLGLIQASLNKDWKNVDMPTRTRFVARLCNQLNIAPVLNPFRFIDMKGVTVLYAPARATALIGNANKVSTEIRKEIYDEKKQILKIYVRASKPDGTFSDEYAALFLGSNAGEARANLEMKCLTKAKRRAVLALVDLSIPDEDELEYLEKSTELNQRYGAVNRSELSKETVDIAYPTSKPAPVEPTQDVDEARLDLMDLITKGDSKRMEILHKFIAANTQGKKLKDLDYEECHQLINQYNDMMEEQENTKAAKPTQVSSDDQEEQVDMFPSAEENSGL